MNASTRMRLGLLPLVGLLAAGSALPAGAGPVSACGCMPDAQVREPGGDWVGDDVYSAGGPTQRVGTVAAPGETIRFVSRAQNDGTENDSFGIWAVTDSKFFRIRYFIGKTDLVDVTELVTQNTLGRRARYVTPAIPPGGFSDHLRVEVTPRPSAVGRRLLVSIAWISGGYFLSGARFDVVEIKVNVP